MEAIRIERLSKTFSNGRKALDEIDLQSAKKGKCYDPRHRRGCGFDRGCEPKAELSGIKQLSHVPLKSRSRCSKMG